MTRNIGTWRRSRRRTLALISATATFLVRVRGAGDQIGRPIDRTLAYLDMPSLRPALRDALQAAASALAGRRPALACRALDLYVGAVRLALARAFTRAEKTDLVADATRITRVIGCG